MSDDPEDEPPEGSGCGGYVILAAAAAGTGAAVYAHSRDGFVILFWVLGAVLIWRAARKINNPSPEVVTEVRIREKPQVGPPTVTQVGESCRIVSQPHERRSYGVEGLGGADSR